MHTIRFVGYGGQGVVLASTILAEAATIEGKHAAQSQSYSAQVRGDVTRGDVIISDDEIVYPLVENPDIVVAMDKRAQNLIQALILLLIKVYALVNGSSFDPGKSVGIDATNISIGSIGSPICANIVLIGALINRFGILRKESVGGRSKNTQKVRRI